MRFNSFCRAGRLRGGKFRLCWRDPITLVFTFATWIYKDRNIEKQNKLEIKGRKIAPHQTYLSLQVSVKTRNDLVKSMI